MELSGAAVLLVAHGSRDPRAGAATRALTRAVAAARPDWDVRAAYLDHSLPRPIETLRAMEAAGHRRAVLVPLLLTAAYHARADVPAEVAAARAEGLRIEVEVSDVLGPTEEHVEPLLLAALARRLHEASTDHVCAFGAPCSATAGPCGVNVDAVVLAAAGTRNAAARAAVGRVAAALSARLGVPCRVAYASAAPPAAGVTVARLRAAGATRVALATYFLAPGLLYDATVTSAHSAGATAIAAPLTNAPELAELVTARVDLVRASLDFRGEAHKIHTVVRAA
jgi:sirohydrochlorin ferrochelatase